MKCMWPDKAGAFARDPRPGDALRWKYVCETCGAKFSVAVPKGPAQERALKCPACGTPHIRKRTTYRMEEAACGG